MSITTLMNKWQLVSRHGDVQLAIDYFHSGSFQLKGSKNGMDFHVTYTPNDYESAVIEQGVSLLDLAKTNSFMYVTVRRNGFTMFDDVAHYDPSSEEDVEALFKSEPKLRIVASA